MSLLASAAVLPPRSTPPAIFLGSRWPQSNLNFKSNGLVLPASYGVPRFSLRLYEYTFTPGAWGISTAAGPPGTGTCPSPPCCPDCGGPEPAVRHRFFVGNEVRTFVPEPATGTLVGLGLVLMGFVGGSRGAAARARRARRS
jgi:hypothetical protein